MKFLVRLFHVKKAKINSMHRETFEQYGTTTMQVLMGTNTALRLKDGNMSTIERVRHDLLEWLTERYQIEEMRENWMMVMEIAITFLVLAELLQSRGWLPSLSHAHGYQISTHFF